MGKGSRWRKTDFKKYFENWKGIKKNSNSQTYKDKVQKLGKTTYKY